jgi:hypothetical protein
MAEPLVIRVVRDAVPLPGNDEDDAASDVEVVGGDAVHASINRLGGCLAGEDAAPLAIERSGEESDVAFVARAKALAVERFGGFGFVVLYDR